MTLNDADSMTMECALEDVRREFQHGDAVIVDAGQHKGRQGFVVAVQRGGALQIFDSAEPQPGEDIPQYQNFHVHSAHVNFLNERSPLGGQFSPTSGVIQRAAETTASLNTVGRRFEGMFVRVVGNVLKNKAGMVVGDFDSPRHANRLDAARRANPAVAHNFRLSDFRGIIVTVREDKKNTTFTVDIKLLVHYVTNLPLQEAVFLPRTSRFASRLRMPDADERRAQRPATPPQSIETADASWGIDSAYENGRMPGERNGEHRLADDPSAVRAGFEDLHTGSRSITWFRDGQPVLASDSNPVDSKENDLPVTST
ncbi:hypothetical protein B0H15DRAFT_958580 [Mycena belliarum]|uniref:KOW domain-containing protein n=1 Tax=Mycena belliarum TaxID=1033014 RepID=A0AAD6TPZ4_9AGAR|nr:hypothetical protein B0H15DRAFT_958580 [Mycena belliae]